jgi:hypothetical protein
MSFMALKEYDLGIVAENKVLGEDVIEVLPIGTLNLMDGELTSAQVELKRAGIDVEEKEYLISINKKATIKALWLNETHRVTPPDVRRGEQVVLYRLGDTDRYFWRSLGRDDNLRRLETVLWRFSGFPDNNNDPLDNDNSYCLEVSTHGGHMLLTTSQRNGEYCRYTVDINTKEGRVVVTDDIGNSFKVDSAETAIVAENANGTRMGLEQDNINLLAPGDVNITARNIKMIKG